MAEKKQEKSLKKGQASQQPQKKTLKGSKKLGDTKLMWKHLP